MALEEWLWPPNLLTLPQTTQDKPNPSKNKLLTMKTQLQLNSALGAQQRKTAPSLGQMQLCKGMLAQHTRD